MDFNSPMAKQFNGPVIDSLLNARHNVFNESEEFMLHRQGLTLENATTEELKLIGKFLCMPRPYAMINGEPEYCDDAFYRIYIRNLAILRQSQSIYDLARMFDQFMPDGRYFVSFQPNGDLLVVLDEQYVSYTPFFQKALDSVFTALPRINALNSWDFDKFVYDHRLYTRLISLVNSDWEFDIEVVPVTTKLWVTIGNNSTMALSYNGDSWILVHSLPVNYDTASIFYVNDTWIVSCYTFSTDIRSMCISKDLSNWRITSSLPSSVLDVIYVESKYIAVGGTYRVGSTGYTYMGLLAISNDLDSWTLLNFRLWSVVHRIFYVNNEYVAFSVDSSVSPSLSYASVSSDLETWTEHLIANEGLSDIDYYDGLWIAVGTSGSIYTSEDLVDWTLRSNPTEQGLKCVRHIGSLWIAVGNHYVVLTSEDGTTWTRRYIDTTHIEAFSSISFSDGLYIVAGYGGKMLKSSDALSWNSIDSFVSVSLSVTNGSIPVGTINRATVVSPSGKLTVTNHKATATIERRT